MSDRRDVQGEIVEYDRVRATGIVRTADGDRDFIGTKFYGRGDRKHPHPGLKVNVVYTGDGSILAVLERS